MVTILHASIETLDEMQRALSNKSTEYQENMSDISEENVQLKINLEKSSLQIEKLKDEQKRADELLSKAGLMDLSGSSGFDIGRVRVSSVAFLSSFQWHF